MDMKYIRQTHSGRFKVIAFCRGTKRPRYIGTRETHAEAVAIRDDYIVSGRLPEGTGLRLATISEVTGQRYIQFHSRRRRYVIVFPTGDVDGQRQRRIGSAATLAEAVMIRDRYLKTGVKPRLKRPATTGPAATRFTTTARPAADVHEELKAKSIFMPEHLLPLLDRLDNVPLNIDLEADCPAWLASWVDTKYTDLLSFGASKHVDQQRR